MGWLGPLVSSVREVWRRRIVVPQFHRLYYESNLFWDQTRWLGVRVLKCPFDLWIYQEIIHEIKPDLIIESGTAFGGGTLFFASVLDLIGHGRIISIDVKDFGDRPTHPRITYFLGSSVSQEMYGQIKTLAQSGERIMVVLDSDHRKEHVLDELRLYSSLVTVGSYLIVEDTNLNGHPVRRDYGPGPMEAVEQFLSERDDFVSEQRMEKFFLTFNPRGFLRRMK